MDPLTSFVPDLDFWLRVAGFVAALLGTCAAVPAATRRILKRLRDGAKLAWLRLTGPMPVHLGLGTGSLHFTVPAPIVEIRATVTGGTLADRVSRLEQHVARGDVEVRDLTRKLRDEVSAREAAMAELAAKVQSEVDRIEERLAEEQRSSDEIDERALRVVLPALAVTTFPDFLAANLVVGIGCLLAMILASAWAIRLIVLGKGGDTR